MTDYDIDPESVSKLTGETYRTVVGKVMNQMMLNEDQAQHVIDKTLFETPAPPAPEKVDGALDNYEPVEAVAELDDLDVGEAVEFDDEDDGPAFEIDFSGLPEAPPEEPASGGSGGDGPVSYIEPGQRLEELLAPYSDATRDKGRKLLAMHLVEAVKTEGQSTWYNVAGSQLYVVKITHGGDFLFVECSCPNGQHRGGDAICYHSIAARVFDAGLTEAWGILPLPTEGEVNAEG